ncbi:hypothetical protein LSM04_000922 [Trypanosoma melophagium]|uniref:uncharacterized protein n=1 Tax=Trypanosoma melophagium TaxID=715481 RepID=UPI00351A327C|nr:hypothetical protein LSM04_000922 [Trypanosoma melophagium]
MSLTVSPRSFRASLLERFENSGILMTPPQHSQQQQQQQKDKPGKNRKDEHVVIENSSLLGRFFDPVDMDTAGSANATAIKRTTGIDTREIGLRSSNSRSFVLNFIDQCVANNVPESLIVEHVLFMIDAMQEQISMTEAMHARFQYDRLRDYEMSELTNMLERQQVYYDQKEQEGRLQSHDVEREITKEEIRKNQTPLFTHMVKEGDISGDVTSQRNQMMNPSLSSSHGRRNISPTSLNTTLGRGVRVAFTQTPHEQIDKETSRTSRGITRTTFHHFMCPTDASNRKERRKYTPVPDEPQRKPRSREGSVYSGTISRHDSYQTLPVKKAATTEVLQVPAIRKTTTAKTKSTTIEAKKAAAAWRGRQRLLDKTGISFTGSSTWSDGDDDNDDGTPLPVNYRSSNSSSNLREDAQRHQVEKENQQDGKKEQQQQQQNQRPPLRIHQWKSTSPPRDVSTGLMHPSLSSPQRSGAESDVLTHEIHSTKKDETSKNWMDARNISSSLPVATLLSVRNPSFYPSPHLQAYIEQSERRVREVDRVLSSIPGNKIDFHQFRDVNMVESPLSADVSDLSDD